MDEPKSSEQEPGTKSVTGVSWPLFLGVTVAIISTLHLQTYNVLYTEGEGMQILFRMVLVLLLVISLVTAFFSRKAATWCIVLLGGMLLLWQANQSRKWAMIHEDIVRYVQFAEKTKTETGNYPATLEGYEFKNDWVKSHIREIETGNDNEFLLVYFMNDPGISYWYSAKTGFGYYPD